MLQYYKHLIYLCTFHRQIMHVSAYPRSQTQYCKLLTLPRLWNYFS